MGFVSEYLRELALGAPHFANRLKLAILNNFLPLSFQIHYSNMMNLELFRIALQAALSWQFLT